MRVHTFVGKLSMEGLSRMDEQINSWLETNQVTPALITQTSGLDHHRETASQEPVLITSIWYEPDGTGQ
jgi:hypothetical protein